MRPPAPLERGPKWLRNWLNSLLKFAVASRPLASDRCDLHEAPDGTLILPRARASAGAGGAAADFCHFALAVVDVAGTPHLRVGWGLINEMLPTGFGVNGSIFSFVGDDGFVLGSVEWDFSDLTIASVDVLLAGTVPANTSTKAYVVLGSYETIDEVMTLSQPACDKRTVSVCALANADAPPPDP